ncbi:hypothetical protein [Pandoravirus japonicus]|uniref:Uncharacterized protein n=1 Tax=Pandoravirus japonicus TaxID=2823154 RepID=A0A811BQY8_9VIRU|nr:hypothetical protein [Pandoravirus japonicus]
MREKKKELPPSHWHFFRGHARSRRGHIAQTADTVPVRRRLWPLSLFFFRCSSLLLYPTNKPCEKQTLPRMNYPQATDDLAPFLAWCDHLALRTQEARDRYGGPRSQTIALFFILLSMAFLSRYFLNTYPTPSYQISLWHARADTTARVS